MEKELTHSYEIYKQSIELLDLLKVYDRAMEDGTLPPPMNEAIIILNYHSTAKDLEKLGSYMLISTLIYIQWCTLFRQTLYLSGIPFIILDAFSN